MHRYDLFHHNWQYGDDKTPFFIKYGYNWVFNGIPKDQRPQIMKQTWDMVKHNYNVKTLEYENILNEISNKDTAKYTTSKKMKYDILETFFNDKFKDKTIVEVGASQGQSTRMLSYIFKKVIAIEWDDWNLEQAKKRNQDRNNVEFVKMDLYNDKWEDFLPRNIDVVFIDAGHQYHQVKMDIENSLECFNNPIFIFDDYGLVDPKSGVNEVKQAIDEKINENKLKLYKFIGEDSKDLVSASSTSKFYGMEGCICNFE
jgi:predicted O-methyltransferase YrrM